MRMPTIYVPHGGGPWPFVEMGFGTTYDTLRTYLEGMNATLPQRPKALVVVSAHWETPVPTVMTAPKPPMLYDYYGFPKASYEVQWPAPGHPELAGRLRDLLEAAGIAASTDGARGFDHGTFVVTALTDPQAEIPTFQLSLKQGLDPAEHLAIGRAISALRDEGVLILGSGMSYHNMNGFRLAMRGDARQANALEAQSKAFDDWLVESMTTREPSTRDARLVEWAAAPQARACHPREEHLLPLMVCAGAASDDATATAPYRDRIMGLHVCAIQFG